MTKRSNISAAIITDGSDLDKLFKAVRSVFSSCREIVICANGNLEEVKFTFRNYRKVKVFPQVWENDFAKARNEAFDKANGQWLLMIDSDEELLTPIEYIDESYDVYEVLITNSMNEQETIQEYHRNYRLFKASCNIRYDQPIHESVITSLMAGRFKIFPRSDIHIHHTGYLSDEDLAKKSKRNTEMLLAMDKCIHRDYYLFRQYSSDQKYSEAIELGCELLNEEHLDISVKAGICGMMANNYLLGFNATNEAKLMLIMSLKFEPRQVYARFLLLQLLAKSEDPHGYKLALDQVKAIELLSSDKSSKLNADLIFNEEIFQKLKKQIESWQ